MSCVLSASSERISPRKYCPHSRAYPGRMIFLNSVMSAAQERMFQARGQWRSILHSSPAKLRVRALAAAHSLDTAMFYTASARS